MLHSASQEDRLRATCSRNVLCGAISVIFALLGVIQPAKATDLLYTLSAQTPSQSSNRQDSSLSQTASVRRGIVQVAPQFKALRRLADQSGVRSNRSQGVPVNFPLTLPRLNAQPWDLLLQSYRRIGTNRHQWTGRLLQSSGPSNVIITISNDHMYARLTSNDGVFVIEPTVDGRHWLIDETDAGFIHRAMGNDALPAPQIQSNPAFTRERASRPAAAAAVVSRIKLLVLYSDGFASRHADPQARIDQLIAVTNQSLANSGVNAFIEPVHYTQISHPDTQSSNLTLNAMSFSEGAFYSLEDLRVKHRADLVTLIRADHSSADVCGFAWIPDSTQMTSRTHRYGFSLAYVRNPAQDGCPDWVLAHELGHNFGADHDRETGCQGLTAYACGYRNIPVFKTIMAYGPSDTNVNVFSSPLLDCNGEPCGFAADTATPADNAQMLRVMAPVVANYAPGSISVLRPTKEEQIPAGTSLKVTWSNLGAVGLTFDVELLRTTGELITLLNQEIRAEFSLNVVCLGSRCGSWVNQQNSVGGQDDYCSGPDCRALASYSSRITLPNTLADADNYQIRVVSSVDSSIQALSSAFSIKQNRVTVFPDRELAVDENGLTDSFSIRLQSPPRFPVRINIATNDASEGVIDRNFLVFTPENWSTDQSVEVTGVDDPRVDGDVSFAIVTDPLISDDPIFSGIDPADIPVVNYDREPDRDNDGTPDEIDKFPNDPLESSDVDDDGIGDNADQDDDNDQLPDSYESLMGLNPLDASDRSEDPDDDNLSNWQEYQLGTNPNEADTDTDKDGIPDIADSAPDDATNSGLRRHLVPGKQWSGRYGNGYGNNRYYSTALYTFNQVDDDLIVSLIGYDIDTEDEVNVLLNNESIGFLPTGKNNAQSPRVYFHIKPGMQKTGINELRINQGRPGYVWGVTGVRLTRIETRVTPLVFNQVNNVSHGYKIQADEENILEALYKFQAPYTDRPLLIALDAFSVDYAGQVRAYLNDYYLGYLLPSDAGAADTQAVSTSFILPSSWLQTTNTLRFEQTTPGSTWGVDGVTLKPVLNIVAPASGSIGQSVKPPISWRLD